MIVDKWTKPGNWCVRGKTKLSSNKMCKSKDKLGERKRRWVQGLINHKTFLGCLNVPDNKMLIRQAFTGHINTSLIL